MCTYVCVRTYVRTCITLIVRDCLSCVHSDHPTQSGVCYARVAGLQAPVKDFTFVCVPGQFGLCLFGVECIVIWSVIVHMYTIKHTCLKMFGVIILACLLNSTVGLTYENNYNNCWGKLQ